MASRFRSLTRVSNVTRFMKRPLFQVQPNYFQPRRNFIKVIGQGSEAYREFLGRNRVHLTPGLRINIPILHRTTVVDMRESSIGIDNLMAYTKENMPVNISGTLFYQVVNSAKACFGVQNYIQAVTAVGESAFRATIGRFTHDEITADRNKLNNELVNIIGNSIKDWGVSCTRFEIQVFQPQNKEVAKMLELSMEAERRRRQNILDTQTRIKTAEGDKTTQVLHSQGTLVAKKNEAEAAFTLIKRHADAKAYEINTVTKAMVNQINTLAESLNGNSELATAYVLENSKINNLTAIAMGPNNAVYFIPPDSLYSTVKVGTDLLSKALKKEDPLSQEKPPKTEMKPRC